MKNHNMWFVFSLLSLVLIAPFGAINSWIAVLAIIISGAFFAVWYIKKMKKQEKEGEVKMSNVIHPGHYNIPGRKECIEEMLDKFGYGKTEAFCELNSYKYQYRHEQKNGQEDLDKASNYQKMLMEYIRKDPRFKVADHYGLEVQMQQLIEEMAELTQAICKYFRIHGQGQPVSKKLSSYDIEQNLVEELADVKLVLDQVVFLLACEDKVQEVMKQKVNRCIERIGEQNAGN